MTIYDEGTAIGDPCPECRSTATEFDPGFRFWTCEDCSTVWSEDGDDPDYNELRCNRCDRLLDNPITYGGGICISCLQREGLLKSALPTQEDDQP